MPTSYLPDGALPVNDNTGFKNRIINGAMTIDQTNNGSVVTPVDFGNTIDRWTARISQTGKFTTQRNAGAVTPPPGFSNYLGITSTSAYSVLTTDYFAVEQYIDGLNSYDFAWGTSSAITVTLSFWVRSSLTGTFGGTIRSYQFPASAAYPFSYTISAANTWEQKTVTITGSTATAWVTSGNNVVASFAIGAGATYSGTAGAWTTSVSGHAFSATGATSVVGTSGATLYITGVQLEKNSGATTFEYRPYITELGLVQNITNVGSVGTVVAGTAQATTSGTYFDYIVPPNVRRITVMVKGISIGNANNFLVQLGSSGSVENSGYDQFACWTNSAGSTGVSTATNGFVSPNWGGQYFHSGSFILTNISANNWVCQGELGSGGGGGYTAGGKTLNALLDRIRVTTTTGVEVFDAGAVNILYEYGPVANSVGSIVPGTAQDTTSGTSFEFPNIPVGTKRITVAFNNVSSAANLNNFQIQLGAGVVDPTGYVQYAQFTTAPNETGSNQSTTGFQVANFGPEFTTTGSLVLVNISNNLWEATGLFAGSGGTTLVTGTKILNGTLDRVRVIINGVDAFDGGSINVFYEYGAANITSGDSVGFKNRLINGNFNIWQRSTTYNANPAGVAYGSADRWAFYSSIVMGANQSTDVPSGFKYSMKLQRPAASSSIAQIFTFQVIESINMLDLPGQTVTVSFWAKAGANLSATSNQLVSQVITGTVADQGSASGLGGWTGSFAAGTLVQSLSTTWTRYSYTAAIPANALEMDVAFYFIPTGTAGADDSVYITGVQLEKGSTATSFDYRSYGTELALCQRYYSRLGAGAWGLIYAGTNADVGLQFPVTMRTTPAVSHLANYSLVSIALATYTVTNTIANPSVGANSVNGIFLRLTSSGMSTGTQCCISSDNNIGLNAEL